MFIAILKTIVIFTHLSKRAGIAIAVDPTQTSEKYFFNFQVKGTKNLKTGIKKCNQMTYPFLLHDPTASGYSPKQINCSSGLPSYQVSCL